jgi:hypothetical protein
MRTLPRADGGARSALLPVSRVAPVPRADGGARSALLPVSRVAPVPRADGATAARPYYGTLPITMNP